LAGDKESKEVHRKICLFINKKNNTHSTNNEPREPFPAVLPLKWWNFFQQYEQ